MNALAMLRTHDFIVSQQAAFFKDRKISLNKGKSSSLKILQRTLLSFKMLSRDIAAQMINRYFTHMQCSTLERESNLESVQKLLPKMIFRNCVALVLKSSRIV
jgi:hypothetical protein